MLKNLLTTTFLLLISLAHPFPANAEVAKWVQDGAAVSTFDNGYSFKYFPAITGAGNDKAFIVWEDPRDNPFTGVADIYVQKLDSNGTPLFLNGNGTPLDKQATKDITGKDKRFPSITKDGSGNAFVVWEDYRNGDNNADIYVQKIDGNGIPLWASDKIICNYTGNQRFPQVILSNTSPVEAIVVWEDHRNSTYSQIYAQKIDGNGDRDPNWTSNGISIASTTKNQRSPAITSDGSNGAIIVWADWRNISGISSTGIDIYGKRINSLAEGQWTSVITNADEDQMFPAIDGDGQDNYVITWEDYRNDIYTSDIYAKGITVDGTPNFSDQEICSAKDADNNAADQRYPRVAYSTADNGFITLWEDYRNDPANYIADIYAHKITYDGTIRWTTTNGVQVAKIDGSTQDAVSVASLDTKGIIATWEDSRSTSVYDIYALPLPIPGSVSIAGGASNTVSSTVTLNLWASAFGGGSLQMSFSNDGSTWSSWETYAATKLNWPLTGNNGTNTVYAQFRDSSIPTQVSPVYSDDITLASITINGGADYATSESVTLSLAGSNCTMEFSNDNSTWSGYEACASSKSWTLSLLPTVDGLKTVYVHFKDNGTSTVSSSSDTITLDKTIPTVGITSPGNNDTGVSLNPNITIPFSEAIDTTTITTGNIYIQGVPANLNYSTATLTATLTPISKLNINTNYTVSVTGVKDLAGNSISPDPYSFSFTTIADNTPPTGTIKINSDAVYTNNLAVTLTIFSSDSDVSQMRFSADGSSWKNWKLYDTSATFTLPSGDGIKMVYVQFMDSVGNISAASAYYDDIILDMTQPSGTISINSGATYTNSTPVTLALSCTDANSCSQRQFSNNNSTWSTAESYAASKEWTLSNDDETKTVYVKFKDNAGNWSDAYNTTIILDTALPTGTININSGAAYTNSTSVTLNLSASDSVGVGGYYVSTSSITPSVSDSAWMPVASTTSYNADVSYTLSGGDETKTVYVWYKDAAGNVSTTYPHPITLDTAKPDTSITIQPENPSNSTSASFTFTSTETGSTFECRIDGASYSSCTSPKSYTGLSQGSHVFEVKATDTANNTDSSAASYTWTIDTSEPNTTITSQPATPSNSTTANFSFSSTETGSTFECRMDGGSYSSCTSPKSYTGLSQGSHVFEVKATDTANNTDSSAASYTWTIDETAPTITIDAVTTPTNASTQTITGTVEAEATVNVVTDTAASDGAATVTGTIWSYAITGLVEGVNTITVTVTDAAGNIATATSNITLDSVPPTVTITSPIPGETNINTPRLLYTVSDGTITVKVDGMGVSKASGNNLDLLSDGLHTLRIEATDLVGNTGSAVVSLTIDTAAPALTINSVASLTNVNSQTITGTTEPGTTIKVITDTSASDGYATVTGSVWSYAITGLVMGINKIIVTATDMAGNTSTATTNITLDNAIPDTIITGKPANPSNSMSASFSFSSTESGSTFQCQVDGGGYSACTSPNSYAGLTAGSHIFDVKATDPAGNTDASPATYTWTIDAAAPAITINPVITPTNMNKQTIAGAVVAGATVKVTTDTSASGGDATVTGTTWSYTITGLIAGINNITVTASNTAGNTATATMTITLDTTPPIVTINPVLTPTSTNSQTITGAVEEGATVNVTTDSSASDGAATVIGTAWSYTITGLAEGVNSITITATDAAGNASILADSIFYNAISYSSLTISWVPYTDDSIALDTNITSGPSNPSKSTSVGFSFTSTKSGSIFHCQIDDGIYAECISPKPYTGLADGPHTFRVKASDTFGNADSTPATYTWTIDSAAPTLTINPVASPTKENSQTITGTVEEGATINVITDTSASDGDATVTGTEWSYTITGLTEGLNNLIVTATDSTGNIATISSAITLDTTVIEYKFAIGDSEEGTDIKDWTPSGTATSVSTGDLSTAFEKYKEVNGEYFGKTFYITVKTIDASGNESAVLSAPFVYTPADINSKTRGGDGRVDGFDLGKLGIAFGAKEGDLNWEKVKWADIDMDKTVGPNDLMILGINFGKVKQ